jgi:hypothetical protein
MKFAELRSLLWALKPPATGLKSAHFSSNSSVGGIMANSTEMVVPFLWRAGADNTSSP